MAIKLVAPFLSKKFDRQASEKLDAIFPAATS
jgi:hypothetical protein